MYAEITYSTLYLLSLSAIFSSDLKLASQAADLLCEAIARFPENSNVITSSSYALLRLSSSGCGGVVNDVIKGSQQLLSYCRSPPICLTDKAREYLRQLEGQLN